MQHIAPYVFCSARAKWHCFVLFVVKNVEKSGFLLTKICFAECENLMIGAKIERQKPAFYSF
jgi:hypothetical protein